LDLAVLEHQLLAAVDQLEQDQLAVVLHFLLQGKLLLQLMVDQEEQ
jgi:hypothetical protein